VGIRLLDSDTKLHLTQKMSIPLLLMLYGGFYALARAIFVLCEAVVMFPTPVSGG